MSDKRLSIRGYARARKASEATIRYHISRGVIVLDRNGRVDPEQADLAWARRRHNRPMGNGAGAQSATARIRKLRARLELAKDEVARLREKYAPRDVAVEHYRVEGQYVIDALRAAPAIEADHVAEQLGIPREKALALLEQFVELCLDDLGDLQGQLISTLDLV